MVNLRYTVPLLLVLALPGSSGRAADLAPRPKARENAPGMAGRVTGRATPLVAAGVYAYQIADKSLHKVLTDPQGNFLFSDLPAGLYQVIAHKPGFVPAVVMVTRATARSFQFLELQLAEQRRAEPVAGEGDFWSVRARIPTDVLRDIAAVEREDFAYSFTEAPGNSLSRITSQGLANFHTDIRAMTGVDQVADVGAGQVSGGQVGLSGKVGAVQVGLSGKFLTLSPSGGTALRPMVQADGAQASSLALDLTAGASSRISLSSANNRLFARSRTDGPVDFELYHLSWSQAYSDTSRSDFAAAYVAESNYHRQGAIDPREIPDSSRTWKVEGAYTTDLGDGSSLQAGLRYRERQIGVGVDRPVLAGDPAQASVDLFGKGRQRLRPAVMVEYGLYSTLSDGSLALTPQGSLLLNLGHEWKLDTTAGRRVYQDRHRTSDFLPMLYSEADPCGQSAGAECYKVQLSKADTKGDNRFSLSAASQTVGETLRLYFSDEFFDRLESVYLVPGDRLPEMQVAVTRRLSPQVTTTLESSLASGGGGTFVSADRHSYKNQVRYLVTSLDTRFQSTSTGVFVAFHHVDQNLDPVDAGNTATAESIAFERLSLRLSQDLGVLMSVASDWTVQLNFELSRASSPTLTNQDSKVMRRILGGFAVKF